MCQLPCYSGTVVSGEWWLVRLKRRLLHAVGMHINNIYNQTRILSLRFVVRPASLLREKNLKITEAADPFHDKTTRHCTVIEG